MRTRMILRKNETNQATIYHVFQGSLIDGALENTKRNEVNQQLGGLGLPRTLTVVEERAIAGKCGNVACAKRITFDYKNMINEDSIVLLSNGDRAKNGEIRAYCSEDCYFFFKQQVLTKRPEADIWAVHQTMLEREKESDELVKNSASSSSGLVGGIKEKVGVKPPKAMFRAEEPNSDATEITRSRRKGSSKSSKETLANAKKVTFGSETIKPLKDKSESIEDGDGSDPEAFTEEDENGDITSLAGLLDKSLKVDDKIENSGLSCFICAWDFLSRVTTTKTRKAIHESNDEEWEPDSLLDHQIIEERKQLLEKKLIDGAEVCDFADSSDFRAKSSKLLKIVASTMDVARPIPSFRLEIWALISFVILSCLDDAGRFKGFDLGDSSLVRCFSSAEIARMTSEEVDSLKSVLRLEKES